MKFTLVSAATLLALGVTSGSALSSNLKPSIQSNMSNGPAHANAAGKERVIVKFTPGNGSKAKAIAKGLGGEIKVDLKKHNSFAMEVPAVALKGLRNNPNIEYIEPDLKRQLLSTDLNTTEVAPWGLERVEGTAVSDNLTGNRTVCIIDSGYDIRHTDLSGNNVTGTNDSGTGNWSTPGGSHGTHVAGTVAAVNNGSGVAGVLPNGNVNLHIIKVFNESGWGYSSSLISAVDDCVSAGSNIISMSLGGSGSSATEANAFESYYNQGVLHIAAAGNDGNTEHSYPASYDSVVSVAATDSGDMHANFSQRTNQVELSGPGEAILSSVALGDGQLAQLTVGGVDYFSNGIVPHTFYNSSLSFAPRENDGAANGALGACTTTGGSYSCGDMAGKICLVERAENQGDNTSSTENNYPEYRAADACADAGASGILVYSNAARPGLQAPFLVDFNGKSNGLPTASIDRATGLELLSKVGQSASMSKSGNQDWEYYNGTSMATPHVSAVAALVWSHHDTCTAAEIREVLKTTAVDLDVAGRDDKTGYGLVKAQAAIDHITENGCNGGGVTPPPVGGSELVNGETKADLSGAAGDELEFTMTVPAGATDLSFDMTGGSGDADLYVKFGSSPTTSDYDCRPYKSGNAESCPISTAQEGVYYVKLIGYSSFSGVSLTGSFTENSDGGSGATGGSSSIDNISVSRRSWKYYTIDIPAGMSILNFAMSGGSGDADLYIKQGSQPTSSSYDCRPYKNGNNESCSFDNPAAGTWHIGIYGYSRSSGISLDIDWNP